MYRMDDKMPDTSRSSPSTLAWHYEKLGGRVLYFGKPQTAAFNEAAYIHIYISLSLSLSLSLLNKIYIYL